MIVAFKAQDATDADCNFVAGKTWCAHRREISSALQNLILHKRGVEQHFEIAVAKEVFGVTSNEKILVDERSPNMQAIVQSGKGHSLMCLFEHHIKNEVKKTSYMRAETAESKEFQDFLGVINFLCSCLISALKHKRQVFE